MMSAVNAAAKAERYQHRYPAGNSQRHQYQTPQYWHENLWLDYLPILSMYMLPEMGVLAITSQSTTLAPTEVVHLK